MSGDSRTTTTSPPPEATEEELRWERIFRYGQERAKALGIRREDVPRLIQEYRDEVASSRK